MVKVPDDAALTGLGRTELVALVRILEGERNELDLEMGLLRLEIRELLFALDNTSLEDLEALKARGDRRGALQSRGG